ncbi:hypothetical protein [Chitinimonas naiadis]
MKTLHKLTIATLLASIAVCGGLALAAHHAQPVVQTAAPSYATQLATLMSLDGSEQHNIADMPPLPQLLAMLPHE